MVCSVSSKHLDELLVLDQPVFLEVYLAQEILGLLVRELVSDVGDEMFEVFVSDEATPGLVEGSEGHPHSVQVMDYLQSDQTRLELQVILGNTHQHSATHHAAELLELYRPVVV